MTNQLPAYLQNMPERDLAGTALANVGSGNPAHLSIQGGRFTLVDIAGGQIPATKMDAQNNIFIDIVIIDINPNLSKIFFGQDKPYDPNNPAPPVCFSDNGIAPSISAGAPQSPTCASCAWNVWGSKISLMGSAVKQCADQQKIVICAPDFSQGLFLLRIPPGSFLNWRSYMQKFAQSGLQPDRVITRIAFEPGVVGTLVFQSPGYIPESLVPLITKMIVSKEGDAMVGRLDRPRQATLPSPATISQPSAQPAYTVPPEQPAYLPLKQPEQPAYLPQGQPQQLQQSAYLPQGQPQQLQQPAYPPQGQPQQAPVPRQRRRRNAGPPQSNQPVPPNTGLPQGHQAPFRAADPASSTTNPPQNAQQQFALQSAPGGAQPQQPQNAQFGIAQNPSEPSADLAAQLDRVFG